MPPSPPRRSNLPGEENKEVFETDLWFHVEDLVSNFLKKRIVITINMVGMQVRAPAGTGACAAGLWGSLPPLQNTHIHT